MLYYILLKSNSCIFVNGMRSAIAFIKPILLLLLPAKPMRIRLRRTCAADDTTKINELFHLFYNFTF